MRPVHLFLSAHIVFLTNEPRWSYLQTLSALAAGWPCVILSDMLTVRLYSGSQVFADGSLPVAAGPALVPVSLSTGPVGGAPLVSLSVWSWLFLTERLFFQHHFGLVQTDAEKEIRVTQFADKSGLTVPLTVQCLEGNGWDLDRAWLNFLELKVRCHSVPFFVQWSLNFL